MIKITKGEVQTGNGFGYLSFLTALGGFLFEISHLQKIVRIKNEMKEVLDSIQMLNENFQEAVLATGLFGASIEGQAINTIKLTLTDRKETANEELKGEIQNALDALKAYEDAHTEELELDFEPFTGKDLEKVLERESRKLVPTAGKMEIGEVIQACGPFVDLVAE